MSGSGKGGTAPRWRPHRRLRWERQLRGWTTEEVATRLRRVADVRGAPEPQLDAATIGRWEEGTHRPLRGHVRLLSLVFDLPLEELRGLGDRRQP